MGELRPGATVSSIIAVESMLDNIEQFIVEKMIPDVYKIGDYYPEYFDIGGGIW